MEPSPTMLQAHGLIPESLIPLLAVLCLASGAVSLAAFSVAEAVDTNSSRRGQELATGMVSAISLGFGTVFFLLWCGVYV